MPTTPKLWKSLTQVNTSDRFTVPGLPVQFNSQYDGQIVSMADGGYVVVWTDESRTHNGDGLAVVAQRYNAFGGKVGGEVKVSQFNSGNQYAAAVTRLDDGNIAVAFVDNYNGDKDVIVRIYTSAFQFLRQDSIDTASDKQTYNPALTALSGGSYAVSYTVGAGDETNIAGRIVTVAGVAGSVGAEFLISNETGTEDNVQLATLTNGTIIAVFEDEFNNSNTSTIKYGVVTPTGNPAGATTRVVSESATRIAPEVETDPDVAALTGGGFVVVWTASTPSAQKEIRATIMTNDGERVADGIKVNTRTTGDQDEPSVVALPDGGFLVTWEDDYIGNVRAQRFNAFGEKVGVDYVVKASGSALSSPDTAVLASGRFAYALGDTTTGDEDVQTSIYDPYAPRNNDFNSDGKGDILFQNVDGTPAVWLLDELDVLSMGPALTNPGPSWHAKDTGDFNGDSKADILWQHDNGALGVWLLDGTGVQLMSGAIQHPGAGWHANKAADFDGDGKADILWQHDNGTAAVWLMNGFNPVASGPALPNPGPTWHQKAAADFNGDGKADILWQNDSGLTGVWLMNGMNVQEMGGGLNPGSAAWHAQAAGDFNGDGKADILWQRDGDDAVAIWLMDGTTVLATGPALTNQGTGWHVKDAIDTNADGKADILWQADNGDTSVWLMDGFGPWGYGSLANPGAAWHVV